MRKLKDIIENINTPAGKIFDLIVQSLIVVSLVTFSFETLPNLKMETKIVLRYMEVTCVVLFTIEYILRIMVATHKSKFIFSFFGIIDLIAILPFYLAIGIDLRSIRILRFLRLFRIFKLVRYSKAIQRFHRALIIMKEEAILFGSVTLILLFITSVGIYYFEYPAQPEKYSSIFASLWWATCTLTTVGYGDMYPITVGGRIFTFFILIIGLGIVAVPAGLMSSALSKAREEEIS